MSDTLKVLFGAVAGAAAGIITGVLIAPASGKETRDKIYEKTEELLEGIKDLLTKHTEEVKKKESAK